MSIASQDFRDGAATGAGTLAYRLRKLSGWGVSITDNLVEELSKGLAYQYGGRPEPESDEQ